MAYIVPPKYVRHILVTLQSHGHQAFLVGGSVRDMLLGKHPFDWDISTSARPEQVMEIFPDSDPTGLKHGTVTVKINSHSAEVTTFRSEGSYTDHRHPDMVTFVGDLTTDLSRRDFTMNAIAFSPDGLMADPFDGCSDIENHLIRAVGLPQLRFEEDALRMFRAVRFSARLGFKIEKETLEAIRIKAPLAADIAPERVRDEIEKILTSTAPAKFFDLVKYGLMDSYLVTRPESIDDGGSLSKLPRKKSLYRWTCLCVILENYGCIESVEDFLGSLRVDKRRIRCCRDASAMLTDPIPETPVEWKRLLNKYGVTAVSCAAAVADVLKGKNYTHELKTILRSGECFSLKHLAVTGDDLMQIGLNGRELGEMLLFLLDYVMEFPQYNQRELLLSLAKGTEE